MPGPGAPYTKLSSSQVLQQSFDEANDRLRVDATVTATIGTIQIDGTGPTPSSIQITDGTNTLLINPDGSINSNVEIDGADGDNIIAVGTEDGLFTGTQHPLKISAAGRLQTEDVPLYGKFVDGNDIGDVTVNNTSLNPVPVTLENDTDLDIRNLAATQDNVLIAGTENGLTSGTVRYFVNNLRQQILATADRSQNITYADFGTKNQRITQIDYTSPTFSGVIARKTINYTLVGTKYRRDSIVWSII